MQERRAHPTTKWLRCLGRAKQQKSTTQSERERERKKQKQKQREREREREREHARKGGKRTREHNILHWPVVAGQRRPQPLPADPPLGRVALERQRTTALAVQVLALEVLVTNAVAPLAFATNVACKHKTTSARRQGADLPPLSSFASSFSTGRFIGTTQKPSAHAAKKGRTRRPGLSTKRFYRYIARHIYSGRGTKARIWFLS